MWMIVNQDFVGRTSRFGPRTFRDVQLLPQFTHCTTTVHTSIESNVWTPFISWEYRKRASKYKYPLKIYLLVECLGGPLLQRRFQWLSRQTAQWFQQRTARAAATCLSWPHTHKIWQRVSTQWHEIRLARDRWCTCRWTTSTVGTVGSYEQQQQVQGVCEKTSFSNLFLQLLLFIVHVQLVLDQKYSVLQVDRHS